MTIAYLPVVCLSLYDVTLFYSINIISEAQYEFIHVFYQYQRYNANEMRSYIKYDGRCNIASVSLTFRIRYWCRNQKNESHHLWCKLLASHQARLPSTITKTYFNSNKNCGIWIPNCILHHCIIYHISYLYGNDTFKERNLNSVFSPFSYDVFVRDPQSS